MGRDPPLTGCKGKRGRILAALIRTGFVNEKVAPNYPFNLEAPGPAVFCQRHSGTLILPKKKLDFVNYELIISSEVSKRKLVP